MLYLTLEDNPFPDQKYDETAMLEVGSNVDCMMTNTAVYSTMHASKKL